ncbi:hypothetical protein O3Q73_004925 [Escherichia coli]|uniref:hypothetical protein n=1 Tax=Escherichia coli TaxID=562 RepID=UPI0017FF50D4|nr:hypothetical protein [Escherichia coli]EFH3042784.1 hypothetical protein [Escherichia coli]EHK8925440.1 hypothetical protein [Escherichia coli]EKG5121659.1 hypothetical protein [Escherichia coli]ELF7699887.1 hypothetical protein [Escherichia coli]MCH6417145.1 hypothetical protein [Escherichia coli]
MNYELSGISGWFIVLAASIEVNMNAVEFTKWVAEHDITGADEKAVYYMALLWIHKAKEAANALGGE